MALTAKEINQHLEYRDYKALRVFFKESEIADIAEAFSELTSSARIVLFRLIPRSRRVDLFSYLDFEIQEELLEQLPEVITSILLNEMEPDDRTKLLEELPSELCNKLLLQLNPTERQVAAKLLSYEEGSVGRMMTPDFLVLNPKMKVSQALDFIHWSNTLPVDYLNYLFVTEDDGTLIGEVSLASLVVADPPSTTIAELMKKSLIFLHPEQDESDAVEIFRKYENNYIPVVDVQRNLLGIVTSDDVFGLAEEEATEDIHQFGGHGALDNAYSNTPISTMIKKRAGWLAFLFLSGFISGEALRAFEGELHRFTFLAIFLPAILSAGGNSGTQSASLIIRAFALNEIGLTDFLRVFGKELLVGVFLGLFLAFLSTARVYTWGYGMEVGLVIGFSVLFVVILGVLIGAMLPFLFQAFKFDPAVASSPFISTLVDVSGIFILFNVTLAIFHYLGKI